ncbi:hypothetical protein HN747_05025 [archaeon]|nr:hypothetical protein [archaeon]
MDNSLLDYIPKRKVLCTLADKGALDSLVEYREIKFFLKLYKAQGPRCSYLLEVCYAITKNSKLTTLLKKIT